jgi:hypothetical protein
MKHAILVYIASALVLTCCTTNLPESTEEAEYQKFVSGREHRVKLDSLTLRNMPAVQEQAYEESGLLKFIKNGELKTRDDMDKFYNEVIIEKYSGHIAQEYLKGKFIRYAITYFDLTHAEKPEDCEYLVRLTRELMATKDVDIRFNYDCLSACRGKMEKEEYNSMVQQAKFEVRFVIEESAKIFAQETESKNTVSKERYLKLKAAREEMATQAIKSLESSLASLEELRMR